LVFQELQAINHYFDFDYEIFYWRTNDQLEVDFVLYGPKGLIAIEVKRAKKIDPSDLKGLAVFKKDYPEAKPFLFYGGNRRLYFDEITAIPFQEALATLPTILGH
jgi:predicted AAA+ superfamily ATPase